MNEDTHGLFQFFNTKNAQNTEIFIWQQRWNMISPVIFAGALTIFAGALPRGPDPGDGAGCTNSYTGQLSLAILLGDTIVHKNSWACRSNLSDLVIRIC